MVPEPYILKETGKIYDLQEPTKKMSKSFLEPKGPHRDPRRPQDDGKEHQVRGNRLGQRDLV